MEKIYDVAVVGGGVAGFSAALTAKNLKLDCLWLADAPFGKADSAEYVRGYPSFVGDGNAFALALERQRVTEEVPFERARVDGVYRMKGSYILTAGERSFTARSVILCTGVELKGNVKGEDAFLGRGVSYCAVCDGALYRGKDIAVLLYSPRFAREVEYLASFALHVHVFFFCEKVSFSAENIIPHGERAVSIEGSMRVERVETEKGPVSVSGVFLLKSASPPSALAGGLETEGPHVKTGRDMSTNLAGMFAAGDVTGTPYQYAKAAGEGLVAAFSAKRFVDSMK